MEQQFLGGFIKNIFFVFIVLTYWVRLCWWYNKVLLHVSALACFYTFLVHLKKAPQSGLGSMQQSSLHENVVFSVCTRMGNAAYIIVITWSSISGLDTLYHFRFNISCGVVVRVRSHQEKFQVIVLPGRKGGRNFFGGKGQFSRMS